MIGAWLVAISALTVGRSEGTLTAFPPNFKFGAATAAYQVEGAWNVSDKSPSVWDEFSHTERYKISDRSDGDVACDSFHNWQRDIQMVEELGLDFYRFSIAWSRLCPNGYCDKISKDGSEYYSKLIDGLLAKGIEPVVTIYHWDIPQRLQNFGGWASPLVVDWFVAYARVVFSLYADRVKTWITINEPIVVCDGVYNDFVGPSLKDAEFGAYLCTRHVLLAHAKAWRMYDQEFRPKYHGKVSLSNHLIWFEPKTEKDTELTALAMEHCAGRFSHPIFSKAGGWPPSLEKYISEKSLKEGFRRSRLPPFTKGEIELIKGTYDFYGLNHYTSKLVRAAKPGEEIGGWPLVGSSELGIVLEGRPGWKLTKAWWFYQNPEGFRKLLVWLKQQYGNLEFLVTENGYPTVGSVINDTERVEFMRDYLIQLLLAVKEDGVDVRGYTAWSLMDNYEWRDGYKSKFGMYEVNFTDPHRARTARSSAHFYADVIAARALDMPTSGLGPIAWLLILITVVVIVSVCILVYRRRSKTKKDYEGVALDDKPMSSYTQ